MKNLLMAAAACLLILLGAVTLPAAPEVTPLQARDAGQEIRVKAGAIIELSLKESPGTGFGWQFDRLDAQHFELLKTESNPLVKNLPGGAALRTWRLKAKNPGESRLTLDYFRPWEGQGRAVKHFTVKVIIH